MNRFKENVDAVVIGSGAGGAPVATVLAEAGASVVILEKGPYYTSRDFVHDEVKTCRRDFWIPFPQDDPHTLRKGDQTEATRTREGWTSHCVGGATVHMSGFFYRMKESDLRLKTLTGGIAGANVADWPISIAIWVELWYMPLAASSLLSGTRSGIAAAIAGLKTAITVPPTMAARKSRVMIRLIDSGDRYMIVAIVMISVPLIRSPTTMINLRETRSARVPPNGGPSKSNS